MAAGPGEPEWGRPGTEALAFWQLRDLVATQEALIEQLRLRITIQEENFVRKEDYEAVVKKLEVSNFLVVKTYIFIHFENHLVSWGSDPGGSLNE
nr:spermatogenesis-associated protein 24-like [Chelonoidis abingdonii]